MKGLKVENNFISQFKEPKRDKEEKELSKIVREQNMTSRTKQSEKVNPPLKDTQRILY